MPGVVNSVILFLLSFFFYLSRFRLFIFLVVAFHLVLPSFLLVSFASLLLSLSSFFYFCVFVFSVFFLILFFLSLSPYSTYVLPFLHSTQSFFLLPFLSFPSTLVCLLQLFISSSLPSFPFYFYFSFFLYFLFSASPLSFPYSRVCVSSVSFFSLSLPPPPSRQVNTGSRNTNREGAGRGRRRITREGEGRGRREER